MFSIVIPLYNKSKFIEKTIKSVLDQTCQDFELIVVNDGSTDDGLEKVNKIIQNFEHRTRNAERGTTYPKITLINQTNSGVSVARNNGVKASRYDYITFLDADDWWDKHFLEEMKGLIEKYPDAGIWGCNYYYIKNGRSIVEEKGIPLDFMSGYIDYFKVYATNLCVPFNCSFVIVSRDCFNNAGGFNPGLKLGEDFDLWVRIALRNKVAYLNKPLAYSNQDIEPEQRAIGRKILYSKESNFIFNLSYLDKDEQNNPTLKLLLDRLRAYILLDYYIKKSYPKEVKQILVKIDYHNVNFKFRFAYKMPRQLIRLIRECQFIGSSAKKYLIAR